MDFQDITTPRLLLRRFQPEDAQRFYQYRMQPSVRRFQGLRFPSVEDAQLFITKLPPSWGERDSWFQIAVIEKESAQLIGDLGVHTGQNPVDVEIGFTLDPEAQGKGYGEEAVKALIQSLFDEGGYKRIYAYTDPENRKSQQLLLKLKFEDLQVLDPVFNMFDNSDDKGYFLDHTQWLKSP